MVTEEASARSLANASQRQRDIDRCCAEVAEIEALLRAGHPDTEVVKNFETPAGIVY
jgi:hypothetical protein